jgi:hypothetical protein
MEVGDKVYLYSGDAREIKELKFEHLDSPIKVYNFEVEDWHTYFVSEQDVFVHNSCKGKGTSKTKGGSETYKQNSKYDRPEIETYSGKSVRPHNATDDWDNFLGPNQTDIDPFTGQKSPDRIWSSDGKRSIRFGEHEMNGMGSKNFHYHKETWYSDFVENIVQRIQRK